MTTNALMVGLWVPIASATTVMTTLVAGEGVGIARIDD